MTTILIDKNIMVPMRDEVRLATDICRLEGATPTPSGWRFPAVTSHGSIATATRVERSLEKLPVNTAQRSIAFSTIQRTRLI